MKHKQQENKQLVYSTLRLMWIFSANKTRHVGSNKHHFYPECEADLPSDSRFFSRLFHSNSPVIRCKYEACRVYRSGPTIGTDSYNVSRRCGTIASIIL